MQIIQNPVVVQQLKQDKMANIQFLKENFNVNYIEREGGEEEREWVCSSGWIHSW